MLQALKLESASRPASVRSRETGTAPEDTFFAGYLAGAANCVNLPGPAPAPAPRPEPTAERTGPERAPARPGPAADRQVYRRDEPPAEGESSGNRVDDARPEVQDSAPERRKAPEEAAVPEMTAADKSDPPPSAGGSAQTAPAAATGGAETAASLPPTRKAQVPAPPSASVEAGGDIPASPSQAAPRAAIQAPVALPKAQTTVSQTAQPEPAQTSRGAQLHLQFSEGAPTGPVARPALTELLSIPKPEMEVPRPVQNAGRMEAAPAKETAVAPSQTAPKGGEIPAQPFTSGAVPATGREALLIVPARTEGQPAKTSSPSGSPASVAGPAASVKGTTPVQAPESAQGARANVAFTQVDASVRWLIKSQEKGAEIQLNPESLGRVVIKLRVEGGEVHAKLWASEATTVPILQEQRAALEASLRQQGLSLGSFDLQQGRRGDDAQWAPRSAPAASGPRFAESREGKQELPSLSPSALGGARLIELLA